MKKLILAIALVFAILATSTAIGSPVISSSDQVVKHTYGIFVFAFVSPVCPVETLVAPDFDCSPRLLPNAGLVLERYSRRENVFQVVAKGRTNKHGYAQFQVDRSGLYRINVPLDKCDGLCFERYPFFEGPVTFRVPAKVKGPFGSQTAVIVHFDSGIR